MSSKGDTQFLRIALGRKKDVIVQCLKDVSFRKAEFIELKTEGLPGVDRAVFFAWPDPPLHPIRIGVDVVQLDDKVLDEAIRLGFDVPMDLQGTVVHAEEALALWPAEAEPGNMANPKTTAMAWHKVDEGQIRREVLKLTKEGKPIFRQVDTAEFCMRMVCTCGRERYSKPNSIHQITACHVCTKNARLRRRSLAQFRTRSRKKESKNLRRPEDS